ncbi:hypothetical protein DFH06DRAFT_1349956 [Mycena polygramma]|nr:hypothetical protein DFH06DRAFT_1349956 [Mycena polygramma]
MDPKQLLATCMLSPALHAIVIDFLSFVRQNGQAVEDDGWSSSEDADSDSAMSDLESVHALSRGVSPERNLVVEMSDVGPGKGAGARNGTGESRCLLYSIISTPNGCPGFSDLPPEVALQIVALLGCVEKARLRRTSSSAAAVVAEHLYHIGAKILQTFDLNIDSVRLLQTVTGAAISGSTMAALLHPTFGVEDLDFVVGVGKGATVASYLVRSVIYTAVNTTTLSSQTPAVRTVLSFRLVDGRKINIIESVTVNPLDCIGYLALLCLYGAWFAGGFWHGYAALTESGVATTTPSRLPLSEKRFHRKQPGTVLGEYVARGFKISLDELPRAHVCGVDFDCPATVRTSNDRGCAYTPLAPWAYSRDEIVHRPAHWSMHGGGCSQGVLSQHSVARNEAVLFGHDLWHRVMSSYMSKIMASTSA